MLAQIKSISIGKTDKRFSIIDHIRQLSVWGGLKRPFRLLPWLVVFFVVPSALANSLAKENATLAAEPPANLSADYGDFSLAFEENLGQVDDEVKFLSRGRGYGFFLMSNEAVLTVRASRSEEAVVDEGKVRPENNVPVTTGYQSPKYRSTMRMRLLQADSSLRVFGEEPLAGKVNYFIGKDPKNWQTDVPLYRKVRYEAVYPGIDLIYYGNHQRQLEYDFVIAPKADPDSIQLAFDGSTNMSLTKSGSLTLRTVAGEFVQQKPIAYQEIDGKRENIDARYVLSDHNVVSFQVGDYDKAKTLVIDPVLNSTTYIGGTSDDTGSDIAVDVTGNIYVTGSTESINFPTRNPEKESLSGEADAYVLKLNSAGDGLVYATYFGGDGRDSGFGIAVDSTGHAHVTGETTSTDLPTTGLSFQEFLAGDVDGFVVKLQPDGNALEYVTYLGGNSSDKGNAIALDESEDAYVTGETDSSDFPTINAVQDSLGGMSDAFIVNLWRDGDGVDYSTYLGGKRTDRGNDIAVDARGKAHVVGTTFSDNFPTTINAFQTSPPLLGSVVIAAFVAKLNEAGNTLEYSTYLGDILTDFGNGIAVDTIGNIYVTGLTQSDEILRCKNCLEGFNIYMGGRDAFIAKFNPVGTNENDLIYYNYLGSVFDDVGESIAVDVAGNAYVAGFTEGTFTVDGRFPFPFESELIEPEALGNDGVRNAFVVKINPEGDKFVYATIFGGENDDTANDIAVDIAGNAYVAGITASPNFPVWNFYQDSLGGGSSAFVVKISDTQIHTPVLPSTTSEPSLLGVNGVLDDLCGLENLMRIADDNDHYWENRGNGTATARGRYSGDPSETLEYIDGNNIRHTVFTEMGEGANVSSSGTLPSVQELPAFRWGLGGVFSSKPSDNADGADHMVTWKIIGDDSGDGCEFGNILIAWEDREMSASDQDYQDLVVEVSGVAPLAQVNELVVLPQDGVDTHYLSDDPRAPAGVFNITATFTNDSSTAINNPFFGVVALTGGNMLLNADGEAGGVGVTLTPNVGGDRILCPGESMTVIFEIGLQATDSFTFFVDLFGGTSPSGEDDCE